MSKHAIYNLVSCKFFMSAQHPNICIRTAIVDEELNDMILWPKYFENAIPHSTFDI
ncbi:hypothetical protein GCM10025776_00880 [Corallincola platygyrae]